MKLTIERNSIAEIIDDLQDALAVMRRGARPYATSEVVSVEISSVEAVSA